MTSKHTPGPWYPKPTDYGWDVWGNLCSDIHTWVGPVRRVISPHSKTHNQADICADYDETGANARLIASAPDMLAALKLARDGMGANAARDAVDAAISKAEGCE